MKKQTRRAHYVYSHSSKSRVKELEKKMIHYKRLSIVGTILSILLVIMLFYFAYIEYNVKEENLVLQGENCKLVDIIDEETTIIERISNSPEGSLPRLIKPDYCEDLE